MSQAQPGCMEVKSCLKNKKNLNFCVFKFVLKLSCWEKGGLWGYENDSVNKSCTLQAPGPKFISRTHVKMLGIVPSFQPQCWEDRQEGLGLKGELVQHNWWAPDQWEPCLKGGEQCSWGWHLRLSPSLHMHVPHDYVYLHFLSSSSLVVKLRASCFRGIHFTKWTESPVPKKRF